MDASLPQGVTRVDLRDVVEAMRKMSTAIALSDRSLGTLTDMHETASAIITPEGVFISTNGAAAALLGYTPDDMVGRSLLTMAASADRDGLARHLACSASGAFHSFGVVLHGRSGRPAPVRLHQQPIVDTTGRYGAFLLILEARQAHHSATLEALSQSQADLRHLSAHLMLAQEKERKRLASELHDGLGQALTIIKLMVEDALLRIRRDRVDEAAGLLDTTVLRIRETLGEVRQICRELRPGLLDDLGLVAALGALCREVEERCDGVMVLFECAADTGAPPRALEADMFRIAQEALNNVVKHAAATEIVVALRCADGELALTIGDNGTGFAMPAPEAPYAPPSGLGLIGMKERAAATGGVLTVQSSGAGTVVRAVWRV